MTIFIFIKNWKKQLTEEIKGVKIKWYRKNLNSFLITN